MRLLIGALLCACLHAQTIQYTTLDRGVIEERFGRLSPENAERADVLRAMFTESGCNFTEQKVRGSKLPNLICTLAGTGDRRIVVTAHFDKVKSGEGAIDNWTGASMLPSLYQSLAAQPHAATYVFLLTTDEEKGLIGAQGYMRSLQKEERKAIAANVNIDCVGLPGEISIWTPRATAGLANAAGSVAAALKIPLKGVDLGKNADADSHVFLNEKIPSIDFHGLTEKTLAMLHTKHDLRMEVDMATYYDTYRLLAAYLSYLDVAIPAAPAAE